MPQTVDIPEIGEVDFPDDMSADDITSAIQTRILKQPEITAPQADIPPLIPDNVSNAYGRAQMATRMVNPSSDRNLGESQSPSENAAIRATPGVIPGIALGIPTAVGRTAYAGAADLVANIESHRRKALEQLGEENLPPIPEYGGNLNALAEPGPLPAEKFIGGAAQEAPNLAVAANVAKSAPELASMVAFNPSGLPGRLIALGFSADMIRNAKPMFDQYAEEFYKPKEEQDAGKLAELKAGILQTFVFAPLAAAHGAVGKSTPDIDPTQAAREALNIKPRDRTIPVSESQSPLGTDLQRYQTDSAYRTQVSGVTEPQGSESNASRIPSTESLPEPEIRPSVGESTPLRQQGEAAPIQSSEVPRTENGAVEKPVTELSPTEFFDWTKGRDLNAEQDTLAKSMPPADIQKAIDSSKSEADALKPVAKDENSINAFTDAANKLQFWSETLAKSQPSETAKTPAASGSENPIRVGKAISAQERFNRETDRVGEDILSWIHDNMRMVSKSEAQRGKGTEWWKANKSQYDDLSGRLPGGVHHNLIYGGKSTPNVVAEAAYRAGIISEPDVKILWDEIHRASNARSEMAKGTGKSDAQMDVLMKEHKSWLKATAKGEQRVSADELVPGDILDVGGERVKVTAKDNNTGEVTLDDGRKFGRQTLQSGETIHVENVEGVEGSVENWNPPEEAPAPAIPKLRPGEKGTGDLLQADAPFNLAGEKSTDFERIAAEKVKAEKASDEAKRIQDQQQGALIGMGGAIPAEFERSGGNETAMKYRRIDQERQQRGLEPLTKPDSVSDQVTLDKAISAIDRDPSLPEKLVKELLAKPRTIEDWENHVLLLRKIDLRDAYEKSAHEAAQAYDDSKQFPNREADMIRANLETARISDELQDLEQASRVSGSARGRALRSLQVMANEDYSLASLETFRRAAKGGAPLTPDERAELTKVAEDYKKANAELQKHIDEKDKRLADATLKEALDKVEQEAKIGTQIHPKIIQIAEKIVAGLDKRADAARQRIKERGFRFNTGVDPTVLRDVAEIGAAHLGHKVLDFAKWSERMISEFGEGIKPHLTEIFAASNKIIDEIKATPAVKRELKNPDVKERIAATSENIQEKIKAGKKDDVSGQVNRLARWLIESKQVDSREGLIDVVHAVLKEADPSITRREAMDSISGYGDFKQLSKDEISTQLRGFKGEMQQISKLEDMAASKPPLKTGMERRTPTDDERALIKLVNESKIKFQVPITDPTTQLKSALDTRKTQVENQTKDLERRLAENDFTKKPRRELVIDRRFQELTAKRDAIRRKVRAAEAEARNKLKTPLEKTFDWVSNARRFAVLSGTKVLLKLAAYSATKLPTMAATEAVGGVLGKLPFVRQIAGRAPSEGGFNARAIANSAVKFFTKGIEDAYKTGIEGHSDIKSAFDTKPEMQRHWYDFAQSLHEVIKSPLRRAAFELSLAKRMEFAARKGTDITDPLVQMTLAKDAYMDSNRALLLENNRLASGIRGLFRQLEQKTKETGKPSLHGKAAATVGRVELPILSVPLNYVKQTLTAAFGLITGSSKLAVAFHRGIENLKSEEADAIMRHLKYGSIGGAMLLYGFYDGYHNGANGTLGGFYQPGQKRRKDQAQFGGLKIGEQKISSVLLHNPMIAVAQLGHTIGAIAASKVKKGSAEERGITVGALTGTLGLLNESPLGRQVELVSTTSDPRTAGEALDEHIKGIVIPQLVNEASQFTDKPAQNLQDYFLMDTRQRKPHGLAQHLKIGVPILREQVPLKK